MLRISIGLVSLFLSVLFVARSLELLPDPNAAEVARRQTVCESLAVECALAGKRQSDFRDAENLARALDQRDDQLVSVGIRDGAGRLVVDVGGHEAHWSDEYSAKPDPAHLYAPVNLADGTPWARVEVAFAPLPYEGAWRFVGGSLFPLLTFVAVAGWIACGLYLKIVFRKVEVVQAKLVPRRVRDTLNTLAEGVLVLDRQGRIALANDAFARSVGTSADELQGKKVSDLPWYSGTVELGRDDHPWMKVLRDAAPQMGQVLGLRTPGEGITLSVNTAPIVGEDGSCRGALATFDNITPIEKARQAAEAANRAKGEFLANVSHEIRTPMNAIIGMTELVLESRINDENRECLEIVQESASNLLEVINDLLDMSKIEAGKFSLDPIDLELRSVIEDALQPLALRAHKKGLELVCDVAPDVPEAMIGDPVRLRQVIVNLVGNAIKFTDKGEIVVRVRLRTAEAQALELQFSVADTGCGIAPEKLQIIFEPFMQEDGSTSRRFGGTGLGLSISSHLVGLMQGELWAESAVDKGSIFHFTARLLRQRRPSSVQALPDVSLVCGLPILVLDDNPTTRRVLTDALVAIGARPAPAESAASAWAELERSAAAGSTFPLLLLDADLGGENGFDLAAAVIQSRLAGAIVVMVSSSDLQRDVQRCRELGLPYVRKPVKRSDLVRALRDVIDPPTVSVSTRTPLPPRTLELTPPAGTARVLLVEDNPFNQKVAVMKLERWGHTVRVARDGASALAALDAEPFDIVFTDVQMPDMDGFELTAAIRRRPGGGSLLVYALTAHATAGIRERCLSATMDGYIAKPINDSELMAALRRAAPNATEEPVAPAKAEEQESREPAFGGAAALLDRVGGDIEVLARLVAIFHQDRQSLVADLQRAIERGDSRGVQAAAHTLKGMVSFFDAAPAVDAALQLERAGERGQLGSAERQFAVLQHRLTELVSELDKFMESHAGVGAV